jgi:hypothetical protein
MAGQDFDVPDAQADGSGDIPVIQANPTSAPGRLTLNLGIVDVPYANPKKPKKKGKKGKGKKTNRAKEEGSTVTKTTAEVAEILEAKYGVMDTFAFARLPDIAAKLEDSIAGQLETMMMGGHASGNPFASAESAIETMFRDFLFKQQIESFGIAGVPTAAALRGVNHRLKHPYAKGNPRRPSFIDTGLYMAHFKAWFS